MRTFKATLFLPAVLLVCLLIAPPPAQAFFGWLDNLSGPGRFDGAEFDFRVVCFMHRPSRDQAFAATKTIAPFTESLIAALLKGQANTQGAAQVNPQRPAPQIDQSLLVSLQRQVNDLTKLAGQNLTLGKDEAVDFSRRTTKVYRDFQTLFMGTSASVTNEQRRILRDWNTTSSLWRGSFVPRISQPRVVFWSSCSDPLRKETTAVDILHEDRHPRLSIVLNYRDLANTAGFFHLFSEVASKSNRTYADGDAIHLRILEPKLSWPMSGRFDFLDGQIGMGIYQFSSAGFREGSKSFSGLVVEPIRLDVHVPGRFVDDIQGKNSVVRFLKRFPLSLSYSAGVLMFPGGFSSDQFISGNPGDAGRAISGGEAIFEMGVVFNVGRLLGL
jgi:hypothetical protein